jgi:acyl carrier protein phosphodiesterase
LNFLAHLHLALPTDASRVGALLGDFVRGTPEFLRTIHPHDLVEGIMLHRAIDRFTDDHPVFRECKSLLAPSRRRFAGIVIDLFFDHLLCKTWENYSMQSLPDFIEEVHATLQRRRHWLPSDVSPVIESLIEQNWLATYETIPGLALTLNRVSKRRPFLASIDGAESDLMENLEAFSDAFDRFYPELVSFARQEKAGGAFNSP